MVMTWPEFKALNAPLTDEAEAQKAYYEGYLFGLKKGAEDAEADYPVRTDR
jgi:hypothetical protein